MVAPFSGTRALACPLITRNETGRQSSDIPWSRGENVRFAVTTTLTGPAVLRATSNSRPEDAHPRREDGQHGAVVRDRDLQRFGVGPRRTLAFERHPPAIVGHDGNLGALADPAMFVELRLRRRLEDARRGAHEQALRECRQEPERPRRCG